MQESLSRSVELVARTAVSRPSALLAACFVASIALAGASVGCVTEVDLLGEGSGAGGEAGELHFLELFADDPLRRTVDLENGVYGAVLQDGEVRNQNSHLDFGWYHAGEFTVGIQGSDEGFIVDLGPDEELGLALTNTAASGFGALALKTSGFGYDPADAVFDDATLDHAVVGQAHVYVIRLRTTGDDGERELVWKALAADLTSETRVVLDWVRLR